MNRAILALNAGSSSVKASLFSGQGRENFRYSIGPKHVSDHQAAFTMLLDEVKSYPIEAVAHRITHGGTAPEMARLIDDSERSRLTDLISLAPLHQPINLMGVKLCTTAFDVPQIACFDTSFHHTMPELAQRLPIPITGMRRFGFHGLSFAFIASRLSAVLGTETAARKIIIAHLGSGSSLSLIENLVSRDTTMGLTALGGVPMSTRPGDLDPGVVLELMRWHGPDDLTQLLYRQSGLWALSGGLSGDMETLLRAENPESRFAIDYYCRCVRGAIGSLAAKAGGLNALVFTGGIGEHAAWIRALICNELGFLGISLDAQANLNNATYINAVSSIPILCMATDEEQLMHALTLPLLPK